MRWIALPGMAFLVGCFGIHPDRPQLQFNEVPPAVRAAFMANYHSLAIRGITCDARGNQYYYTLTYVDMAKCPHTVILNEGGDEIDGY